MEFKIGTRVIVRPIDSVEWEYKGEIVSDPDYSEFYWNNQKYYSVMHGDNESIRVSKINVVKIRMDKEWDRDQKINSIINE